MTPQELDKALARAKIGIMQKPDTAFFSALCSSLKTTFSEEISTAGTDGKQLIINPKFFEGLTLDERIFLLAHETMHVAYLHVLRKEHRDHRLFNMAADYVINLELVDRGFTFIKGGLLNPDYRGMTTEEIYKKLEEIQDSLPQLPMDDLLDPMSGDGDDSNSQSGSSSGSGNSGEEVNPLESAIGSNQAKKEAIEQEIKSKIARAIMIAEMQNQAGSVPASIKRHFSDLSKPKVNWRVVLKRFLNNLTNDDYSWRKPNRKYLPHYLPKLHSTSLGRIDFAIDTSGSINEKQFTQFIAEVHAVLRMLNPKEIGVYQFGSVLQGSDVVKKAIDLLKVPFSGGGGTNPQAALTEFEKNNAMGLIVLTDGEFYTRMLKDPQRPVIWVVYNNPRFVAPFGTTVHFNLNEL